MATVKVVVKRGRVAEVDIPKNTQLDIFDYDQYKYKNTLQWLEKDDKGVLCRHVIWKKGSWERSALKERNIKYQKFKIYVRNNMVQKVAMPKGNEVVVTTYPILGGEPSVKKYSLPL